MSITNNKPEEKPKFPLEDGVWVSVMYVLRQHDGYDSSFNLATSSEFDTLNEWKIFLDRQGDNSPVKRSGKHFVVEGILHIHIPPGAKPSITAVRDLLGLSGQE